MFLNHNLPCHAEAQTLQVRLVYLVSQLLLQSNLAHVPWNFEPFPVTGLFASVPTEFPSPAHPVPKFPTVLMAPSLTVI